MALHDLQNEYFNGPVESGEPVVSYRETVNAATGTRGPCLSKSPNKHNRLYMTAQPLGDALTNAIDKGDIPTSGDPKPRVRALVRGHAWNKSEAGKVWCFGPDESGPNVLVEQAFGTSHLPEIHPHVAAGFQWATKAGPICEEPLRGVRFNLVDAKLHADAIHRGAGQLMPTARRVFFASVLCSEPGLQEPLYRVDITVPTEYMSAVYSVVTSRRGVVLSEEPRVGTPLTDMVAHLPVADSFGFVSKLRAATSGRAFPNLTFECWQLLPGDPLGDQKVKDLVKAIRERKGLKANPPPLSEYLDRL